MAKAPPQLDAVEVEEDRYGSIYIPVLCGRMLDLLNQATRREAKYIQP